MTAAVAERAAACARRDDPLTAATLLGSPPPQRERATWAIQKCAPHWTRSAPRWPDATLDRVRALPRADVIALLQDYVRGLDVGSAPARAAAGSDPPAAAFGPSLDSASATSRA